MKREPGKEFDSIILTMNPAELLEYCKAYKNPRSHAKTYQDRDFCQWTWDEALSLLERGWEEGVKEIDVRAEALNHSLTETPYLIRDVTGDFFDVGLVVTGEPEVCYRTELVETPNREITVVVNCMTPWDTPQGMIYNRGAVICAIIDRLRKN